MIVTGDTHIPIDIHKLDNLTADFAIVCGDLGLLWNWKEDLMVNGDRCWTCEELYWLEYLESKPFTTLWVDGNHENYDRLKKYPVEEWQGGKVHRISDKVIHLMRGQVFTLNGKTFFTMGGAESHDRGYATGTAERDIGKVWWPEEVPSEEEWEEAERNLERVNFSVDYVITHEAPGDVKMRLGYSVNGVSNRLWYLKDRLDFKMWYCGHLHRDEQYGRVRILYNDITEVV